MKISQKKIEVFNGKLSKYGGHSQWLSRLTHLDYLIIDFVFGKPHYDHYWYCLLYTSDAADEEDSVWCCTSYQ